MTRTNVSSGLDEEENNGSSRAVRIGNIVKVGATGPVGPQGETVGENTGEQTAYCFEAIGAALDAAGASLGDVVMTRIYVTSMEDWEAAAGIHGQLFAQVRPACSPVMVSALMSSEWSVMVEAEAIVSPEMSA